MSSEIQLACIECCTRNGGELIKGTMAQTFIGVCQCCGEVKPLSNIHYWKNVGRLKKWEKEVAPPVMVPPAPEVNTERDPVTLQEKVKPSNAPRNKGSKLSSGADFS